MSRVFLADFRELGYCVAGVRTFCRSHGLDFRALAKEGLDAEKFIETGDRRAIESVAAIKERNEAKRGR